MNLMDIMASRSEPNDVKLCPIFFGQKYTINVQMIMQLNSISSETSNKTIS